MCRRPILNNQINSRLAIIDVVLMDVQMPELDGLAATQAIRKREAETRAHLPIIAVTADATAEDRKRGLAAGMDGYLSKPFSMKQLMQAIEAVFGQACPPGETK